MFALVDVNNFYASCEQLFDPKLRGRPVVVLSNNDGCVVARSAEARALGIPMAAPWYMLRVRLRPHGVIALSSNYTLYADMSDRVVEILSAFTPSMEVYSIDESFLDVGQVRDCVRHGREMRDRIRMWLGLPVCVGIGPSKTLAGMTLASGCGSKTLIRIGAGNLKSLVVALVMAVTAYMTLRGILGAFRVAAIDPVAYKLAGAQDLPTLIAGGTGMDRRAALAAVALVLGGGLLVFTLRAREFRNFDNLLGGLVAGLAIVAAWYLSGYIGHVAEDPQTLEEKFYATNSGRMESLSFVSPLAYSLELLMLWTDKSRVMTLGIATTLGLCAGSFAYAVATRSFRLESFRDARDLLHHMLGGVLMGFGGVLALGCTIGQGLSGISTLAPGSFLALASIITGAAFTMKWQYHNA